MSKSKERATIATVTSDWKDFIVDLKRDVSDSTKKLENGAGAAPYDAPDGVLKRSIYQFVRDKLNNGQGSLLEDGLDDLRTAPLRKLNNKPIKNKKYSQTRHRQILFNDNPFHCALRQIPKDIREFRGDELTRFGRQLLYAHRHDIEPDLLVGFLLQTGTMKRVAANATDPKKFELWYQTKQEAAKSAAARKSRYPLAIIHFTATSTAADSYPIEIGFAKARGKNAPILVRSILIKPSPNWSIKEKWPPSKEQETGINVKDLCDSINSYPADDVIAQLTELTEGIAVVHCDDIGNASHWLDTLISEAGILTGFQLRDIGDFLEHNANKRAELRRKRRKISIGIGSAGEEAKQLCEVVRTIARR